MLAGYARVDALVSEDVDLFAMGSHQHLLALNHIVLCGEAAAPDPEYARHRLTTEERFYEEREGGIGDLVEWYARHAHASPWRRAAGVYIRILSAPQLFIEGNHRTGALIISYLLLRAGLPPFVLTPATAAAYFGPSTLIRNTRRNGIGRLFRLPGLTRRFASFLAAHADPVYLLPER